MKGSETTTLAPDERRTRAQAVTKPPDIETSYKPAPGYSQETHNRPLALLSLFSGHKPFGGGGKIVELYIKFLNQVISRLCLYFATYFSRRISRISSTRLLQNSKCLKSRNASAADCVLWLLSPGLLPVAQCQNCQSLVNLRQIKCSFIV